MLRISLQFLIAITIPLLVGLTMAEQKSASGYDSVSVYIVSSDYPENLPGPYTGGFGEETCHSCHFDYDINDERGKLTVQGPDGEYKPGDEYDIIVAVESERLANGGFQMTARFEDGTQAGQFTWLGDRLTFTTATDENIQYIQHSKTGTATTSERKVTWSFVWTAPENNPEPVIFNIAANAGNDDFSAFGDWIYVQEFILKPVN